MSDGGGRAPASCVTCGRVIAGASRIDGVRTEVFASAGAEAHIPDVGEPAIDARFRRFVGLSALPGSILVKWMGLLHGRPPRLIREPQSAHQQRPIAGRAHDRFQSQLSFLLSHMRAVLARLAPRSSRRCGGLGDRPIGLWASQPIRGYAAPASFQAMPGLEHPRQSHQCGKCRVSLT